VGSIAISTVQLKGPAGSASTDKRTLVSTVNLHGPIDKRAIVSQVTLVAPPPDARTRVSQVQLVGPASSLRPVYYGAATGWVPIDIYLPVNGVWQKIT
jgi:hypothetical protein